MLFVSAFVANAQIIRKTEKVMNGHTIERNEFHLGDYIFKGCTIFDGKEEHPHYYYLDYDNLESNEINELYRIIKRNKSEIEAKYNVYISKVTPKTSLSSFTLELYDDVDEYNAVMAQKENEKIVKENEMNDRLNSIL